ncbi:MAG: dTDP-4-dehydrorhamnose 3,5-epimerase [Planctomycetia bacterium]|nr:dTDP-4-dehydrorhamnose 3,5-epimerase [Planctomycetia bacterium]
MKVEPTGIPGVLVLEPKVFEDARGCFFESFNHAAFEAATGQRVAFVQDNHSVSRGPVLRGLHYQAGRPQGKLVRVVAGSVFDVAVDIRPDSATRGRWVGLELSAENRRQIWIPPGLAHGFLVTSPVAEVLYKATDSYDPASERCIIWNDLTLAVAWPLTGEPIVSAKDARGEPFA